MINLNQAVEAIRKKYPYLYCRQCLEYKDFFMFAMAPLAVKETDDYASGHVYPAVRKSNGEVFEYDIFDDLEAFNSAKRLM